MALIPAGYIQANLRFSGDSSPNGAEVTLGFDASGYVGDVADMATEIGNEWIASIRTVMPSTVVLASVLVKAGPNATGPAAEVAVSSAGSGGGASASPNVAILVRKNTAAGGRTGRGRFYHPGPQESEVNPNGTLSGAFVSGMQTEVNDFFGALATAGLDSVLLHSETSPVTTPTPITSFTVDSRVATQRRRLRG